MAHLFVIAGHGAGDPGACAGGWTEAERVRALAKRIKELGGDNVTLGDLNRDYYADNGISTLNIPADWEILELHMDFAMAASAKGAHIVIQEGCAPDQYDSALAGFLSSVLPGRASSIVGRDNLANLYRASARGYSYRLAEIGFISNAHDLKYFNENGDVIATGILNAFGIAVIETAEENTKPSIINATVQLNSGANNMRLLFEKDAEFDNVFKIKDKENGYYLTAAANKKEANVDFRAFSCGDYQRWKLIDKQYLNASYKMLECIGAPDLYLSVEGNGINDKKNLKLYTDLHNMKQKFFIREETDGSTLLVHAFSFKCVSAK